MLEKARDDLRLLGLLFELNDLFEMRVELVLVCCSRELNINMLARLPFINAIFGLLISQNK